MNLKDFTDIDSTSLGTLVFGLARLRKSSGKLALVNLNRAQKRFDILNFVQHEAGRGPDPVKLVRGARIGGGAASAYTSGPDPHR